MVPHYCLQLPFPNFDQLFIRLFSILIFLFSVQLINSGPFSFRFSIISLLNFRNTLNSDIVISISNDIASIFYVSHLSTFFLDVFHWTQIINFNITYTAILSFKICALSVLRNQLYYKVTKTVFVLLFIYKYNFKI